jgi:TonB family protein
MAHAFIAAILSAVMLQAQTAPQGRTITALDGDTVIITNSDRVRVVRRREGNVRVVFNPDHRFLIVLIDNVGPGGAPPDGRVDFNFSMNDVQGEWPLGLRWDGSAIVDDYVGDGGGVSNGTVGIGITTSSGLVHMFNGAVPAGLRNPAAIATLTFRGNGRGLASGTFDQEEQRQVAQAMRGIQMRTNPDGSPRFTTSLSMTGGAGAPGSVQPGSVQQGTQPVRVGSVIRTPVKLVDVPAVMPEAARRAGVAGMVILEVTIGADGAVKDAKVLRSIPLLDQAALDAVRQWLYEPTLLNGVPVPVIITATVNFTL